MLEGGPKLIPTLNVIVYGLGGDALKQITTGTAAYLAGKSPKVRFVSWRAAEQRTT